MFELHWSTSFLNGVAAADTRRQLRRLSDHQLSDIGVRRDQIDEVAHGMVARSMTKPATETKTRAKSRFAVGGWRLLPWPRTYRAA